MPHTRTKTLNVGMAIIMAMWVPLLCCCHAGAAQIDSSHQTVTTRTAEIPLCHGSQSHHAPDEQESPSPGSHCPSDAPGDDCLHHQQMASAANDGFVVPTGLSVDLLPTLKLLPAFTPLDVQQARPLVQRTFATASQWPIAGTLRAQHVLLLI